MIIEIDKKSDFSIHNLPFGIFTNGSSDKKIGIAIGNRVFDLTNAVSRGLIQEIHEDVCKTGVLNEFISLGKEMTNAVRNQCKALLSDNNSVLEDHLDLLLFQSEVEMHMPVHVGDYTDFYSSLEHATNVGLMFRDPSKALMPNWKHLPVAYHGRASSVVVSGTDIKRPKGQMMPRGVDSPVYGPSRRMDFELETGFIIGKENRLGDPIRTQEASDYIFGMVLLNDWSARDIQKWEYVPLGPFLGKNFATQISPWVVTMEALEAFRVKGPTQIPEALPYLKTQGNRNIDIELEVSIQPQGADETVVSRSNFKYMYWNMEQQLAHHTVNGCNVRVGDIMGSGTISGKDESSYGSMLEISWAGSKSVKLNGGSERKFIEDNDTVIMRGHCEKDGIRVGFGELSGKLLPANK